MTVDGKLTWEEQIKEVMDSLIPYCGTANIEPRIEDIISICGQKIDEACKKARIDENQKWINSEYHSRFKGILRHEFSNRIIELSKPSPKESEL